MENIMENTARTWEEHKLASNILWEGFISASPGSKEREDAKDAYLAESKDFWGEEALGITQLQGRIASLAS